MHPTISVVIPNYNRADLLIQAITSVLEQSYPVMEILVCDDGSTDDSKSKVLTLQKNHPHIQWIDCGKNGRPAIPRNIGIAAARGEWIAFLDNDDTWARDKIEKQLQAAEHSGCAIICTNAWRITADQKATAALIHLKEGIYTFKDLLSENFIVCSSILLRKDILNTSSLFPKSPAFKAIEDYALWLELALDHSIHLIQAPLVNYLDAPQQSIRSRQSNEFTMYRRILFRTFYLSFMKVKWGKAIRCMTSLIRNSFYEMRYYYRVQKSGGAS